MIDEEEDLEDKGKSFAEEWESVWMNLDDVFTFCWDMVWGFVDGGKSFEAGLEILDSTYNLYDWLSPETRAFIKQEE